MPATGNSSCYPTTSFAFSPFSSVGSVNGQPYAYNPNLYDVFKDTIPKAEWWFWGHEHTLGIFPPYIGLKRGRCVRLCRSCISGSAILRYLPEQPSDPRWDDAHVGSERSSWHLEQHVQQLFCNDDAQRRFGNG